MADFPADVSTGRVHGTISQWLVDSADAGVIPDVAPFATASIKFTPSVNYVLHPASGTIFVPIPDPITIEPGTGAVDVTLVATDDPDINPVDWTYRVDITVVGGTIEPFNISVPSGSDRLLTELVAVPLSNGTYTAQGPPGASAYEVAVANGFVGTEADWLASLASGGAGDATTTTKGLVKLAGDLGGTADVPTVPGLASKSNTGHTHIIADVTGLQTALDGKQPAGSYAAASHTHTASQVSDSTTTGRALLTAADAATARASLGLGTAATTASTAYATAAQGTKADTALQAAAAPELIRDTIGTALVPGANVTITPNDAADTITIAASGGGSGFIKPWTPVGGWISPTYLINGGASDAFLPSVNQEWAMLIFIPEDIQVDRIGSRVYTGVAGCVARMGLYANVGGVPSVNVTTEFGQVDLSANFARQTTLAAPVAISAGYWWVSAVQQGAAARYIYFSGLQNWIVSDSGTFDNGPIRAYSRTGVSGALSASTNAWTADRGPLDPGHANEPKMPGIFLRRSA